MAQSDLQVQKMNKLSTRKPLTYLGALNQGDDKVAAQLVNAAVRKGDPSAMAALGIMHALGRGVDKDEMDAYAWLLQAANRGVPDAMVAVGICLASGEGVQRNLSESAFWLHRAAKQGYLFGMGMLAWLCERHPEIIGVHFSEDDLSNLLVDYAKTKEGLTQRQRVRLDQLHRIPVSHPRKEGEK